MIFDRLFQTRSRINTKHPKDPILADWLGMGGVSSAGVSVNVESAMQEAAVFSCVRVISEDLAKIPLNVYKERKDGGREKAKDHPLYEVLHFAPNINQTSMEWRESRQAQLLLRGDGLSRIISTGGNAVAELRPMERDRTEIFKAPSGRRAYRYQNDEGKTEILLSDEVLHVPGLSFDGISGLNPIRYYRETIGLGLGLKEYGAKLFANGVNSNLAITHPGNLKPEQLKQYRENIERVMVGRNNWHRPLVFEGGAQVEKLSLTAEDSQFLESRKYNRSEIASLFRVPLYKIAGDAEKSKGWSTLEQQATDYIVDTLMPWLVRWEQAMNRQLLSMRDRQRGYYIQFDIKGLLRGDAKTRAEYYRTRFGLGSLSPNDIRRLEDEDPIKSPGADNYYLMTNLAAIDKPTEEQ